MKVYIQRFRYAATGRWAVSLRTYLLVFPFGYLVSTERELIFNQVTLSRAALIALSGELASFLYLFLAQGILLRRRNVELQAIWRCFFVWISTGLVRGVFVAAYAKWAFGYEFDFAQRVPAAAMYTTAVMALAAVYFGSIDRRRTEYRALQSLEKALVREEGKLLEIDARNRIEGEAILQNQLLPQVKSLQSGITSVIAQEEREGSREILHDLYERSVDVSNLLEAQRSQMEQSFNVHEREGNTGESLSYWAALTPHIMSVRITVTFFILGSISGQFSRNGMEGVLAGVLGVIPLLIVILPTSQLIKRTELNKVALFLFGFIGVFVASYIYNVAQPHLGFELNHPYAPWYSAAKTVYGLYFASVIASLLVDFGDKRDGAVESGVKTVAHVKALAARNSALERAILVGKYGTLQGKITGVTMALHLIESKSMGVISPERKMRLLGDANELLSQALDEIDSLKLVSQ